jgi:hypothetical protein
VSAPKVKSLVAVVPRHGGIGLNEIQEFTQAMYTARRYGMACRDRSFRRSGKRGFNGCASCWRHWRTDRVAPMSERLSNPQKGESNRSSRHRADKDEAECTDEFSALARKSQVANPHDLLCRPKRSFRAASKRDKQSPTTIAVVTRGSAADA